jgi:hypothetical protein
MSQYFYDKIILEYNGVYRDFLVAESLSVYNICSTFAMDLQKAFCHATFVCVVKLPENTKLTFVGQGRVSSLPFRATIFHTWPVISSLYDDRLNAQIPGAQLVKNGVYQVVTDPPDLNADTATPPAPLHVTIQHLKNINTFDLSGKTGLVKFRLESELDIDRYWILCFT